LLAAGCVATGVAGCKKRPRLIERSPTAYIIGPNNIVPVDDSVTSEVTAEPVKASVLIATRLQNKRVKFCSGSLIAADHAEGGDAKLRVLTNHHCFATTDDEGKAKPQIMPEACGGTSVYFGFAPRLDDAAEASQVRCAPGSLRTDFEGDLAVFTLEENPPAAAGYRPVTIWDGEDVPVDRQAFIIHYPDIADQLALPPGGKVKLPTAQATLDDCRVLGGYDVSEWDLDRTLPYALRHTCDLIHGSSGSGLFDRETGKLLGVNWGGLKVSYGGGTRTDNVATRASYVLAFLSFNTAAAVEQATAQKSSHAAAATQRNGSVKDKSVGAAEAARKQACGVAARGASTRGWPVLFMLAAPLIFLSLPRRRLLSQK
jgi:hypothetical protein